MKSSGICSPVGIAASVWVTSAACRCPDMHPMAVEQGAVASPPPIRCTPSVRYAVLITPCGRALAAAQSLRAAVNIVAVSGIASLHPCMLLVLENLRDAEPLWLVPEGSADTACKELLWIQVFLMNSSVSIAYALNTLSKGTITSKLAFSASLTRSVLKLFSLSIWWLREISFYFVYTTGVSVPLYLKVRVGLNYLSDIFIRSVPYGPTVGSFVFSLSMMESANLTKQILRKWLLQWLNTIPF